MRRLKSNCERAKRTLSSSTTAFLELDALYEGIDFSLPISRAKFEHLNESLFKNTIYPCFPRTSQLTTVWQISFI